MKLRWLGIATVLLLLGASAACGPECPEGQTKCGEKLCVNTNTDRAHCGACDTACESGLVCSGGKCEASCQKDLTLCEGVCANTKTDAGNCGSCGTKCKSGQVCNEGKCEITCPDGQTACGDICTSTGTDPSNCGACGTKCDAGQICNAGKCEVTCSADQTACGSLCSDTKSDYNNCGACGTKCEAGQVCNAGKCETSCQKDLTDCSGSCVNTKTDYSNCGACGTACKSGELCKEGKCELTCATGTEKCGDACINTQTSRDNCGACGTKCDAGQICTAGKCELSCPKDITDCSGKCIDLQTDNANCGACGTACPAGEVCSAGKCAVFCQKGFTDCSGSCVDLQSNAGHCGKCGDTCPQGQVCGAGACVESCAGGELSCANGCTNVSNDAGNCGACGTACKAGEACLAAKCTPCADCPQWGNSVGSFASDYIEGVAVDTKGNSYAIGYFYEILKADNITLTSAGSGDIFVIKFSPSGRVLWAVSAGGSSLDYGYGIAVDTNDNVYITGGFQGTADFGATSLTSAGSYDIFVAKLDKDGKWLWAKGYGSTSGDYGRGIAVDAMGNAYVTGYYYSTTKFGATISVTAVGGSDIFIGQWDTAGVEKWVVSAGSSSSDYGRRIAVDSAGNSYTTGYFYNSITFDTTTLTSAGSADVFVVKLDNTGKVSYAVSGGGSSLDYGYAIAIDAAGNAYVGGGFSSSGADFDTTNLTSVGSYDAFVAKVDTTGKWSWAVGFGGTSSDYVYGVAVDSKGGVFATGYYSSGNCKVANVDLVPSAGGTSAEIFLVQIDATGKDVGATSMGGSSSDYANDMKIDSKDNLYIGGDGSGLRNFGQVQVISNGGTDGFVVKYAPFTQALCPTGATVCNNACTDIQTDNANCGACSTLCSVGQVCGGGKCISPPADVFLQEYHSGSCCSNAYFAIKNYGTVDVDLKGLHVMSATDYLTYTEETYTLPTHILKAGATVYFFENSSSVGTGDFEATPDGSTFTNIYASNTYNGMMMLCFGPCDAKRADNVLDLVMIGVATTVAAPTGLTFFPNVLAQFADTADADANSYVRTGTTGKSPTFSAADWTKMTLTRP